mmetsp:Transcript_27881/g.58559  ORF Transcript_27881/g.58559 Transcript_27881/m.58559 type:complete len:253 (-) Transcript_27881:2488-3246(-)
MTIRQFLITSLFTSIASVDAFVTPSQISSQVVLNSAASSRAILRYPTPKKAKGDEEAEAAEEAAPEAELPSEEESDILNSPAFLKRKKEVLESDLAALEKEVDEANAVYLKGKEEWGPKFDLLNKESQVVQDRMAKQTQLGMETATLDVAGKMLGVIDTYERAFGAMKPSNDEEVEITEAYQKTYDMIMDAFATLNVTKVETVGAEFDYELHQAVMQLPSDEFDEGIVCQELAPGWRCGEKLIRPAMVVVTV